MRNFHDLRKVLEALIAARSEEALRGIERVTAVAGERCLLTQQAFTSDELMPSEGREPEKKFIPFCWLALSELSRLRTGFGGGSTCS